MSDAVGHAITNRLAALDALESVPIQHPNTVARGSSHCDLSSDHHPAKDTADRIAATVARWS